jgi:hypothetical protein
MAALNRFISKPGEWGLPFFKLLKHQEKFVWTPEADQALAQLKDFLSKPPVLTAPRKGEELLLYLTATTHVVSTAIIVERQEDGHAYPVQHPVYFISEVLSESKARYQPVQKLLYAVLIITFFGFFGIFLPKLQMDPQPESATQPKARGLLHMECDFAIALPYEFRLQDNTSIVEDQQEQHSRTLGTTREGLRIAQTSAGVHSSLGMLRVLLRTSDL